MNTVRHAVYWAPEAQHPLWRAGGDWLGRAHTAEPSRYGFHATLKAPMALRAGAEPAAFADAVAALAARTPCFTMPSLEVAWLAGFLALRPVAPLPASHPLQQLADACVRELDPWRAATTELALLQRLARAALDAQQRELLKRWGYPHVFTHWRFHMTLTDDLLPDDLALRRRLEQQAREHFAAALAEPLTCESICLFVEPAPGEPFELTQRFPLAP
jgi:hypothetical protein